MSDYTEEMSSNHHLSQNGHPKGEIEHVNHLSEHIGALYLDNEYSDVILLVESEPFHAHKVILASRSEYFRALLFGGMKESKQSMIELKGTTIPAFKALLKYIYTGCMSLGSVKEDVILDILGLAHLYGFTDLEAAISDYLCQTLTVHNACNIYDAARLYQLQYLSKVVSSFLDSQASVIIQEESFLQLSAAGLKEIIEKDSFYAEEKDIFKAVCDWARYNSVGESSMQDVLSAVRLPLMSLTELLTIVRPTKLVSPDNLLDAILLQTSSKENSINYRGCLIPEVNMASPSLGSQVELGEMRSALLDGDSHNYDMERGFTRHTISDLKDDVQDHGILIQLGRQSIINHIKMLLWDRDCRSYSYYIEVSMDRRNWVRIVDHTNYYCRSWQFLYFKPRVVKFIRIVGTNNTVNKVFHVVSFEVMYTNKPLAVEKGLVVPKENVATSAYSASVIEGVSRSRNALLDGNTTLYDWDSGYTCHQLGSGAITVQLGQPYMIDSIRLLLWDCDDRSYRYFVEVSVNNWEWEMVADKTHEECRSWQVLRFPARPVVFIKIVGTHNTANEVFHCVHVECPAQTADKSSNSAAGMYSNVSPRDIQNNATVNLQADQAANNQLNNSVMNPSTSS